MLYFFINYSYSGLCTFGLPNTWGLRTRTGDQSILRLVPTRACIPGEQGASGHRQWAHPELHGQCCLLFSSHFLRVRFTRCLCRDTLLVFFISHPMILTQRWELPRFARHRSTSGKPCRCHGMSSLGSLQPQCHTSGLGNVT